MSFKGSTSCGIYAMHVTSNTLKMSLAEANTFASGVCLLQGWKWLTDRNNGGFCLKTMGYGLASILSTDCLSPQTVGLHFLNFSRLPKMTREDFCASPWNLPRKLSIGSAFMSEMILTASMIQQANGSSFF